MKGTTLLFVLFVTLLSVFQVHSSSRGLLNVGLSLHSFQTSNGGFVSSHNEQPTLKATSNAAFLAALLGEQQTIESGDALNFIETLENTDGGFGQTAGSASDLASLRQAVLAQQNLKKIINPTKITTYLTSLIDANTKLFGDLKSTAMAFDVLRLLDLANEPNFKASVAAAKAYLSKSEVVAEQVHFAFAGENLDLVAANYYGTLIGSAIGYEFNLPKFAHFIAALQNKQGVHAGGFFADAQRTVVTLESTYQASVTLFLLQQHYDKENFLERVDVDALARYVAATPITDLNVATEAFTIIGTTKIIFRTFDAIYTFETLGVAPSSRTIVQGTQLRPVVKAKALDGTPRGDFAVEVTSTIPGQGPATTKLDWNRDSQQYSAPKFIDTASLLGPVSFEYSVSLALPGIGINKIKHVEAATIGYEITVDAQAHLDVTGKQVEQGETVSQGAEFSFTVSLRNKTVDQITSGRFTVSLTVLDSSKVAIHKASFDPSKTTGPISFTYTLQTAHIPAGDLIFQFEVIDDKKVSHSVEEISYKLETQMIATQISFVGAAAKPTFQIGQTVKVSIVPASFPDLKTVYTLDEGGAEGAKARKFYLDIKTANGIQIVSVLGKSTGKSYTFEYTLPASFEFIGSNYISFKYVAADGEEIVLSNYNDEAAEIDDSAFALVFNTDAQLQLVDVSAEPSANDFYYGNEIVYKFRVKDKKSNTFVHASSRFDAANVFLSLSNEDKAGRVTRSVHVPATSAGNDFTIRWLINPNAVNGAGVVTLSAQDADSNTIAIVNTKDAAVEYQVNVGGSIDVKSHAYTVSTLLVEETAFVVEFSLSCKGKLLKEALLRADVLYEGSPLTSLPVVTNEEGVYSVSWTEPHKKAYSGRYQLHFYREADKASSSATPLFNVDFSHSAGIRTLPVQTEFLVFFVVLAGFLYFSFKRSSVSKN